MSCQSTPGILPCMRAPSASHNQKNYLAESFPDIQ
ncbi:unnamed protein product, partial [Staurois parvus]